MSRIAYVNGRYCNLNEQAVSIEDRGFQFADGVYEVIKVVDGRICDLERHLVRLERSLSELKLQQPMSRTALTLIVEETFKRNKIFNAIIYIQVSRGIAPRNHLFPKSPRSSLVVTVRRAPFPSANEAGRGCSVVSAPDQRWARCDIKSISLLPNVLAKQAAHQQGSREAWLFDEDGFVTEGSSSNAYIIDSEGRLITRGLGSEILGGITRFNVLEIARTAGIEVIERAFTLEEAKSAREAFLTSTTSLIMPVVQIDDTVIANGVPGSLTLELQQRYNRSHGLDVLYGSHAV